MVTSVHLLGILLVMLVGVNCLTVVVVFGEVDLEYVCSARWTGFSGPYGLATYVTTYTSLTGETTAW